uniref:Uncharacterized protein n=1 Tax=Rhodosorus marinus TaxID=101924 RepID=A0A7S0BTC3_9RHOD
MFSPVVLNTRKLRGHNSPKHRRTNSADHKTACTDVETCPNQAHLQHASGFYVSDMHFAALKKWQPYGTRGRTNCASLYYNYIRHEDFGKPECPECHDSIGSHSVALEVLTS